MPSHWEAYRRVPHGPGALALAALTALAAGALLQGCASSPASEMNLRPDVTRETRALLIERYSKGKVLYRRHCAECHGIFQAGRDSVPNFSRVQLDNYNSAWLRGDPKNHMVAARMSQEQVTCVLVFLETRKRDAK